MDVEERVRLLVEAAAVYQRTVPAAYEEVVEQVAARAAATGSLGKLDLGALTAWKRMRADTPWMTQLMGMPDAQVREHTAAAVAVARDVSVSPAEAGVAARAALADLPGLGHGDALASAVCYSAAPHRLAVYDTHAHATLTQLGLPLADGPGRYGRYLLLVERCREELIGHGHTWTARQVDLALFQHGHAQPAAGRGAQDT